MGANCRGGVVNSFDRSEFTPWTFLEEVYGPDADFLTYQ
jgi:hypothetical protein